MSDRQTALEFLGLFSARRLDEAAHLMVDGLRFVGPSEPIPLGNGSLGGGANTRAYGDQVVNVIEDEEGITVLYEYEGSLSLIIAQWFRFQNHRIVETELTYAPKDKHQDWSSLLLKGIRCELRLSETDRTSSCHDSGSEPSFPKRPVTVPQRH